MMLRDKFVFLGVFWFGGDNRTTIHHGPSSTNCCCSFQHLNTETRLCWRNSLVCIWCTICVWDGIR